MDALLTLLKDIGSLQRAPRTVKGDYPAPRSPYKPIMLLVVLRRVQQGIKPYSENRLGYEACLRDFSALYSKLYGSASELSVKATQAFWYLGAGKPKIWNHVAQPGMEQDLAVSLDKKTQVKSQRKLTKLVKFAQFSPENWALIADPDVQRALIAFLIAEQFTDVRRELELL